ncbi:MAG: acetyl-CoA hydrolase/transferase C-terminal domain-containing protein [Pseudomonadota bacterium]
MTTQNLLDGFAQLRRYLPSTPRIYVGGGSGTPVALAAALRRAPELANGVTFLGAWIPGLDTVDWASLHPTTRAETTFLCDSWRDSAREGKTQILPLTYSQTWNWLASTPIDAAVFVTSEPGSSSHLSLGVSPDFGPALLARNDIQCLAITQPTMPTPIASHGAPRDRFSIECRAEADLPGAEPARANEIAKRIAKHIAPLIEDGDTLQFGIGSLPSAILSALHDRRGLKFHSGLISDDVVDLIEAGAVSPELGSVLTGIAYGSERLYRRAAAQKEFRFEPVTVTHSVLKLAEIERFKSINSALEVDLLGQVNSEFRDQMQVSAIGGQSDFVRGAALSKGGRSIIALPSTAAKGTVSRIVPRLENRPIALSRYDIDTVVTEHGVAELRQKTPEQRAQALTEIADPVFRESLSADWSAQRSAR